MFGKQLLMQRRLGRGHVAVAGQHLFFQMHHAANVDRLGIDGHGGGGGWRGAGGQRRRGVLKQRNQYADR